MAAFSINTEQVADGSALTQLCTELPRDVRDKLDPAVISADPRFQKKKEKRSFLGYRSAACQEQPESLESGNQDQELE